MGFSSFCVQERCSAGCWRFAAEQDGRGFGIDGAAVLAGESGAEHTASLLQLGQRQGEAQAPGTCMVGSHAEVVKA